MSVRDDKTPGLLANTGDLYGGAINYCYCKPHLRCSQEPRSVSDIFCIN